MSKPYLLDLTFKDIFAKAIREWPASFVVGEITTYPNSPGTYTVPRLWDMGIIIERKAMKNYYKVLLSSMHDSIEHEYKRLAREKNILKWEDLDLHNIKKEYDGWLKRNRDNRIGHNPSDYLPHEMSMVHAYLKDPRNNVDLS